MRFNLKSVMRTDEEFFRLCQDNAELRLERAADGEVLVMPPAGAETGRRNMSISVQLGSWARADGTGVAFDSSTGFTLPSSAVRSPDAAWLRREVWDALSEDEREGFAAVVPDFVVELRSKSDRLDVLLAKMEEYREAGVRLGWLIDPIERRVHVYRADEESVLEAPESLDGGDVLPNFVLSLVDVW